MSPSAVAALARSGIEGGQRKYWVERHFRLYATGGQRRARYDELGSWRIEGDGGRVILVAVSYSRQFPCLAHALTLSPSSQLPPRITTRHAEIHHLPPDAPTPRYRILYSLDDDFKTPFLVPQRPSSLPYPRNPHSITRRSPRHLHPPFPPPADQIEYESSSSILHRFLHDVGESRDLRVESRAFEWGSAIPTKESIPRFDVE